MVPKMIPMINKTNPRISAIFIPSIINLYIKKFSSIPEDIIKNSLKILILDLNKI